MNFQHLTSKTLYFKKWTYEQHTSSIGDIFMALITRFISSVIFFILLKFAIVEMATSEEEIELLLSVIDLENKKLYTIATLDFKNTYILLGAC